MILDVFRLDGQVAAVTGATRGIGYAMALALAEAGADIALLQRSAEQKQLKEEIERLGRKCTIIPCDMNRPDDVKNAVPSVVSAFGKMDILVNNAGIQRRSPAVDFPESDWDDVINVNLKAVWMLCQQAGRIWFRGRKGKSSILPLCCPFRAGLPYLPTLRPKAA